MGLIAVTQARRTVPVNTFRETKQNTFVVNVIFLRETTIKVSLISRATAFFQERQNPLNWRVQQKYFINRSVVDGSRVRKKKLRETTRRFVEVLPTYYAMLIVTLSLVQEALLKVYKSKR